MTEAVVEYDYKAKEPDELNIKKGDIITDISIKPGGWWEGTLNGGKRGMFPDNFVKLIKNEDGEPLPSFSGRKCRVNFPYEPLNPDELRLHVGDVIDIISEVEEGWWKGCLKHKIGVFPSNFVVEITDPKPDVREASQRKQKVSRDESVSHTIGVNMNASEIQTTKSESSFDLPVLPPKPTKEYYKALYKYEAENADELSIQPGDVITLLTKDGQDPGWWKGELKGKVGFFPDNFVEQITYEEANKSELKSRLSNRAGSTISKSATTSSICESGSSSITRKFSDTSKISEEKLPPSVGKKPVLPPPPSKKPPSSVTPSKHAESPPASQSSKVISSSSTTIKHSSSMSETTASSASASSNKWTVVEGSSDGIDGLSWSKQQSYTVKSESSKMSSSSTVSAISFNSTNNSTSSNDLDLDMVGRDSMLTHPTASRAKAPKRRPPSAIINLPTTFSLHDEMNNGEESPPPTTMVNGDAEAHVEKQHSNQQQQPPWVGELKLSQAKKSMQGKTRVMIGMSGSTENIVTQENKVSTSTASVTSTSSSSTASSSLVTLRQQPVIGPRPQSLLSSLKSITASQSAESVTISLKQWNELLERVSSLESNFESQIVALTKAVKDLTGMLEDETHRRVAMQQELDKLTDLVTQV
nr:CD2-associated protein-like [Halyomorpha halys]